MAHEIINGVECVEQNLTTIQSDIAALDAQTSDIYSDLNSHDTELSDIHSDISRIENTISDIQSDITVHYSELSDIHSDILRIESNISDIYSDLSAHDSELSDIRSDISRIEDSISDIYSDLSAHDVELSDILSDIARIENTISDIQSDITAIEKFLPYIRTASSDITLTSAQMYGATIYALSDITITLDDVFHDASVRVVCISDITVHIDPDPSDLIYLDGDPLADGNKISCPGASGDEAILTYFNATGWYATTNGWTNGG